MEDVHRSGYTPTHYVAIARAGVHVVDSMGVVGGNIQRVRVSRPSTPGKQKSKVISMLLLKVPYSITNIVRRIEHFWLNTKRISKNEEANSDVMASLVKHFSAMDYPEGSKVLVVDDAVDSGNTLSIVKRTLNEVFGDAIQVRTAVIVVTTKSPQEFPDYYLMRDKLCRFPWSSDFKK